MTVPQGGGPGGQGFGGGGWGGGVAGIPNAHRKPPGSAGRTGKASGGMAVFTLETSPRPIWIPTYFALLDVEIWTDACSTRSTPDLFQTPNPVKLIVSNSSPAGSVLELPNPTHARLCMRNFPCWVK